jgi:uncharacterized protein (TIGR02996 family)
MKLVRPFQFLGELILVEVKLRGPRSESVRNLVLDTHRAARLTGCYDIGVKSRRFEHARDGRFWQVCWENSEAEVRSGELGSAGHRRRTFFKGSADSFVEAECARLIAEGYDEIVPSFLTTKISPEQAAPWLERIRADPSGASHLVFADVLQQHRDARGELIAVQCKRAQLAPWHPEYMELRAREDWLLSQDTSWVDRSARLASGLMPGFEVERERGFIEWLGVNYPLDEERLARQIAQLPFLRSLELKLGQGEHRYRTVWPWDLHPAWFANIRRLRVYFLALSEAAVESLMAVPNSILDAIALNSVSLRGGSLARLFARSWRELDLGGNNLEHRFDRLGEQPDLEIFNPGRALLEHELIRLGERTFPKLRKLALSSQRLTPPAWGALFHAPMLRTVEALDLSNNFLLADLVNELGRAELPSLVSLNLRTSVPDGATALALVKSPLGQQLRRLDLRFNEIDPASIEAIDRAMPEAQIRWR